MNRFLAIVEREMRKFFRSPVLMIMSMMLPLVQLVILGNAFGGKIHDARIAFVDQDGGPLAHRRRPAARPGLPGHQLALLLVLGLLALDEVEVAFALRGFGVRHLAGVDAVGVYHDHAFLGLSENFVEAHYIQTLGRY